MSSLAWRIGQFFLFIGLLALFIFFVTLQAGNPSVAFCFSAGFFTTVGGYALWRGRRTEPAPDERFRYVRKIRSRGKKK